jgi:hypothetical protein
MLRMIRARRERILQSWEDLLRRRHVSSPLANPDIFVHDMPATFDAVLTRLEVCAQAGAGRALGDELPWPPSCPCGRNPFLAYYRTAEEALGAAVEHAQADLVQGSAATRQREREAVRDAVRGLGRRDIEGFAALCQCCPNAGCRHLDRPCPRAELVALQGVATRA